MQVVHHVLNLNDMIQFIPWLLILIVFFIVPNLHLKDRV